VLSPVPTSASSKISFPSNTHLTFFGLPTISVG
jgi:hypothetical protein